MRRKLDETSDKLRETVGEAGEKLDEAKGRVADEASGLTESSVTEDLDAKRREVHEQAREAVDEMRDSSSD